MDVEFAVRILASDAEASLKDVFLDQIYLTGKKRIISPKTLMQKAYMEAIRKNDIVFGIGPAGTGKTYLAMAMAVDALIKGKVDRIVLARPAVEAGEKLGYLPGDLAEKVNPYLRPLYDALHDMMDFEKTQRLMGKGVIEVAPLAFMRGRTLNNSFVILDEAQNSTSEQMKMFLTRLGYDSQAVVTGDVTQVDLPNGTASGLGRGPPHPGQYRRHQVPAFQRGRCGAPPFGARYYSGLRQGRSLTCLRTAPPSCVQPAAAPSRAR
jgi:phosphate starvation-inducible PhoH-like protein